MIIKCDTCKKKMTSGDTKILFADHFDHKNVPESYLPIYFYIIFDANNFCCKQTLMNYIRPAFLTVYHKSKKNIDKMISSNKSDTKRMIPYLKQLSLLLEKNK